MKITVTTQSPVISSSGESTALIDADVKYDKYGLPYIQGKTFKGLLKESAKEVCEITGENYAAVEKLFGTRKKDEAGKLYFNDLLLKDHVEIANDIDNNGIIPPGFVKNHYTVMRRQTTIDDDGVAKDHSLRNYRLIKEGLSFCTEIENLTETDKPFIELALLNLRYMGVRRNRGFGKIECRLFTGESEPKITNDKPAETIQLKNEPGAIKKLSFKIKTAAPVLFSKVVGEQNTVSTEPFIPAQNIRGLIAGLISNQKTEKKNLHKDSEFKRIILEGAIKYNNAFLNGSLPTPRAYGFDKSDSKSKAVNVFEKKEEKIPLKGMSGFSVITPREICNAETSTSFSFHNSRENNRRAGRSEEESGAIFYYESIDAGQVFDGVIEGPENCLMYIQQLLEQNHGRHRMGRSRTAQYATVCFTDFSITDASIKVEGVENQEAGNLYLVFQSPVITYNDNGMAVHDKKQLEKELLDGYGNHLKIENIASAPELVETYMGTWNSKTPREVSFDIGTTIQIKGGITGENLKKLIREGLGERKNEGYGRLKIETLADGLERMDKLPEKNKDEKKKGNESPSGLSSLRKAYENGQTEIIIKTKAIDESGKLRDKLPNSLITRLKEELNFSRDIETWQKKMNEMKEKKAGKTLDSAHLWKDLYDLKSPDECSDFEDKKLFWITYFKALRRKNHKNNQDVNG